jgi:hypothetical protein
MEQQITELFCTVDDFCKEYEAYTRNHYLPEDTSTVFPKCAMSLSELMTIVIWFHLSDHRTFKWYYKNYVGSTLAAYFPHQLSYNRVVEVMSNLIGPLTLYLMKYGLGKCTGISFVDSTTLEVCHPRRIHSHKVFTGSAKRGKSSTGWFYGFKLHLVINDRGEILSCALTPGNITDNNAKIMEHLTRNVFGRLFGDKGYLSKTLFTQLFQKGITLVTKVKKNMKNKLLPLSDKLLLRKRAVIESVNDFLKNICQIEHSRHRSPKNFLVNLLSGLIAYSRLPKKPSLHSLSLSSFPVPTLF